jgi:hypothetical protein
MKRRTLLNGKIIILKPALRSMGRWIYKIDKKTKYAIICLNENLKNTKSHIHIGPIGPFERPWLEFAE